MSSIHIILNGERREIAGTITIDQILELFSLPKQRIAVELNNAVLRRKDWPITKAHDGDKLEIVHFVGGG